MVIVQEVTEARGQSTFRILSEYIYLERTAVHTQKTTTKGKQHREPGVVTPKLRSQHHAAFATSLKKEKNWHLRRFHCILTDWWRCHINTDDNLRWPRWQDLSVSDIPTSFWYTSFFWVFQVGAHYANVHVSSSVAHLCDFLPADSHHSAVSECKVADSWQVPLTHNVRFFDSKPEVMLESETPQTQTQDSSVSQSTNARFKAGVSIVSQTPVCQPRVPNLPENSMKMWPLPIVSIVLFLFVLKKRCSDSEPFTVSKYWTDHVMTFWQTRIWLVSGSKL